MAGNDPAAAKAASPGKSEKEAFDWKKIAAQMDEMQRSGGIGDMRAMMKLQQRVQAMTKEEIIAALDQVEAMDISDSGRAQLEGMLLGQLTMKDPELALTKFADHLQDSAGSMRWQLSNAFSIWLEKDQAKAAAWFDQQIAAGKFETKALDGRSGSRIQFEGAMVRALLATDLAAAGSRLAALPVDQRADALRNGPQIKAEDQLAFAKLVREQLPENERGQTLSNLTRIAVSQGGYDAATAVLDRIAPTPEERSVIVTDTAESRIQQLTYQKPVSREDLDAMRGWVGTQAPGIVDKATGDALASAVQGQTSFTDAATLALQYQQASGNDDVLVSFLSGWKARQNKGEAIKLAASISDVTRREEILKTLQ